MSLVVAIQVYTRHFFFRGKSIGWPGFRVGRLLFIDFVGGRVFGKEDTDECGLGQSRSRCFQLECLQPERPVVRTAKFAPWPFPPLFQSLLLCAMRAFLVL